MALLKPVSEAELAEMLAQAAAAATPLELVGRGSKRVLGRPMQTAATLDLSAFSGIIAYEPEELVLTAGPATPLAEVEAALAARSQALAFEPPDLGPLLGGPAGAGSLGGALLCNLSGPRRLKAGAARDHLLGFQAVSGDGACFKGGGKVVKNVTGYDLSKLICGSWGTLAAVTEVTLKVLPAPEKTRTLLVFGLDPAPAVAVMAQAMGSPHEVSGAAYLPAPAAARSGIDLVTGPGRSVTALRLEGHGPSVEARLTALRALLRDAGPQEELHSQRSLALWRQLRDGGFFAGDPRVLWRISVAPSAAPQLLNVVWAAEGDYLLDWAGGLVWLAVPAEAPEPAGLRPFLATAGGHATLIRAPESFRATLEVFTPESASLQALARRVKAAFDPRGILNPGRLHAGL